MEAPLERQADDGFNVPVPLFHAKLSVLLEKENEPLLGEVLGRHLFHFLPVGLQQARQALELKREAETAGHRDPTHREQPAKQGQLDAIAGQRLAKPDIGQPDCRSLWFKQVPQQDLMLVRKHLLRVKKRRAALAQCFMSSGRTRP
jgi:hypothetical protein